MFSALELAEGRLTTCVCCSVSAKTTTSRGAEQSSSLLLLTWLLLLLLLLIILILLPKAAKARTAEHEGQLCLEGRSKLSGGKGKRQEGWK